MTSARLHDRPPLLAPRRPAPLPRAPLAELMAAYAERTPVRSVAVVGNAPLGPSSCRSAEIDGCDLVIRVNGFALDEVTGPRAVGRRADVVVLHWAVKASPWLFEGYSERLYLLNEPGQMHFDNESVPAWWPDDLGAHRVPNRETTMPLVAELGLADRERPMWATTGTVAVHLALTAFPRARVAIAGFSAIDDPAQSSWAHAWGGPATVEAHHDLRGEAAWLHRLIEEDRLAVLR